MFTPLRPLRSLVRANYDLETEELDRLDVMLKWRRRQDLPQAQLQYILRRQEYEAGSWWEQFRENLHAVQLLRGSVRWRNTRGLGGEVLGFGSFIDERKTAQIGGAVARLQAEPPGEREVVRFQNRTEAAFYDSLERVGGFGGKADQLNDYFVHTGNPDYFEGAFRPAHRSLSFVDAAPMR